MTQSSSRSVLAWSLIAIASSFGAISPGHAGVEPPPSTIEVRNIEAFVPSRGYDSNDTVEVVVDGILPNSCWTLGETFVKRLSAQKFLIRQYAHRKSIKLCTGMDAILPMAWRLEVPFNHIVRLGRLKVGMYEIQAGGEEAAPTKRLEVARAVTDSQDDLPYVPVSSMIAPEFVGAGELVKVTLSGRIGSKCLSIVEPITATRTGDVIVLTPTLELLGPECDEISPYTFERTVSLGRLPPGRYLVHARSANGQSFNRLVTVFALSASTGPGDAVGAAAH